MKDRYSILPILGIALVIVSAGVLLDAAFQLSRLSFLSRLGVWQITVILINSIAIALLPVVVALGVLQLLLLVLRFNSGVSRLIIHMVLFAFSIAFIAVLFVHLDTWAYTRFRFNVAELEAAANWGLLLGMVVVAFLLMILKGHRLMRAFGERVEVIKGVFILLFVFLGIATVFKLPVEAIDFDTDSISKESRAKLPNIILFSSDGVDSDHMSTYGYERKTTPNIDVWASMSTVYTMAFANGSVTTGSVVSTLTGKSPLTTRVIYHHDILRGRDAFEHLPGVLAELGYYCVALGDGWFGAPGRANMQAFHNENGTEAIFSTGMHTGRLKRLFNMEFYFLSEIGDRIWNRISYMAGLSDKLLRYRALLKRHELGDVGDVTNMEELLYRIRETDEPLFVHIHLLKTHGELFNNIIRKFSAGREQENEWDMDFYDDSILTMDYYFGEVVKALVKAGKFDDTVMVFSTDHGQHWRIDRPLPLIVHLPGQRAGKVVDTPVQLLDIAPSLLSYLGLGKPDWMEGAPIFSAADRERLGARPIYAFTPNDLSNKKGRVSPRESVGPPFYGFREASLVKNEFIYRLHLKSGKAMLQNLSGPILVNRARFKGLKLEYRKEIFGYLESRGIDTSSLLKGG